MNQEIRKFLIDQCVKGKPVYYEEVGKILDLDLSLQSDRQILSNTLGGVSEYEHSQGRPLISSIAIYKSKNDHGYGFYNLCAELGLGSSKKLQEELFGFTQIEASKKFWQNERNFNSFYDLNVPVYDSSNSPSFFDHEEILFLKQWADRVYDKTNINHKSAKDFILNTVWTKTKFWSQEVVKRLSSYEASNRRVWSKRGWEDGNRVATFKPYTWARIFKIGDKERNIFFTIGVQPSVPSLVIKLDYYHESDSSLNQEQKDLCDKHIPKSLKWTEILAKDLPSYNWEKLINHTVNLISENSHHYDQVVDLVWRGIKPTEVFGNSLSKRDYPEGGFDELPPIPPTFEGVDIDFVQKNIDNKDLGDAGEELVKDHEIKFLESKGLVTEARLVEIMKDGEGYDIKSFDEHGNEIFIEVKTTRGKAKTPFHLSIKEKMFCELNNDKYRIYRLYNYNDEIHHADYFVIDQPLEKLLYQPTDFKVYLRRT